MDYDEIYTELVYERNALIEELTNRGLLDRKVTLDDSDIDEKLRHSTLFAHRKWFREKILKTLNELDAHDAIEALYDFNKIELRNWTDSELNRLELELEALQMIIGKLEARYTDLYYRQRLGYDKTKRLILLNKRPISMKPERLDSFRHALLTAIFSNPDQIWKVTEIEEYLQANSDPTIQDGDVEHKKVAKAVSSISTDVAESTGIKQFWKLTKTGLKIDPKYLR